MLLYVLIFLMITFCFVIIFGAPYVPTTKKQITTLFDILELNEGQTLLELGSGDGRVLKAAAKRGIKSIGIELNPLLVLFSKLYCFRYRDMIDIRWGNFWSKKLPKSDAIYIFLLDKYMKKLLEKIKNEAELPMTVASFAFEFMNENAIQEKSGLFIYLIKS